MDINQILPEVTKQLTAYEARLSGRMDEMKADLADAEQLLAQAPQSGGRRAVASIGKAFAASEELQHFIKVGMPTTGKLALEASSIRGIRAALSTAGVGQTGDGSYSPAVTHDPRLAGDARRALTLLDVLTTIKVDGSSFEYNRLDGYTNAAGVQLKQGDAKATAVIDTDLVQAQIATIAHIAKVSTQTLSDAPALQQQIGSLMQYGVLAKLENLVINGTGGAGNIDGLLHQATVFTATATTAGDRVGQAAVSLQASGWMPSVIVMNPVAWFDIASAKNTGDGAYTMGSPRDPSPASLWSLPVVLSPSLAAGTALVLDAVAGVALLDREDVNLAASQSDGDNFSTNRVSLRAEMRAGLAVFAPSAVLSVDLTA